RGDALDRAWRELLNRAIEADGAELERLLVEWEAPAGGEAGARLDRLLEEAVRGGATGALAQASGGSGDTVSILEARIEELQQTVAAPPSRLAAEPDSDRPRS